MWVLVGILASSNAIAHADRILPIGPGGAMPDVPLEFGPANLQVGFSAPLRASQPISSLVLALGDKRIEVPACITSLLRSREMKEVQVTGSWYHDESILPYYLNLSFFEPGYSANRWANPGVELLINLRTGQLIEVKALVDGDKGRALRHVAVDLSSRCSPEVLAGLKSPPVP